jgi:NAD(P)-dependent dehydrogenase (short-subunit alcohol dehydrogenase family)
MERHRHGRAGYPHSLSPVQDNGLRLLRLAIDTHLITSHYALPLLIRRQGGLVVEMTDGTAEYNASNYRVSAFYDLAKSAVLRLAWSQGHELADFGCTAVALTPGWMRSEMMLENHGVTEANWRDALARPAKPPYPDPGHFGGVSGGQPPMRVGTGYEVVWRRRVWRGDQRDCSRWF